MRRFPVIALVVLGFISGVAFVYSCGGGASSSGATVEELETRIEVLEAKLAHMVVDTSTVNGLKGPHVIIEGANLHVRSGAGSSYSINGLGNLIVGYNEEPSGLLPGDRDGSNNIVVGTANRYTSFGGVVAGSANEIGGPYAVLAGGLGRTATANYKHDGMPDYDSGWQGIDAGDTVVLNHNLGGSVNDYNVEIDFNVGEWISDAHKGGSTTYTYESLPAPHIVASARGATWQNLTDTSITVQRYLGDTNTNYVRIRIWKYSG